MATLTQMKRGLSLRPTYDQVLNSYLSGGPDIKKPNRIASFIRESPQYQNLLKDDFIDLQKQQNDMLQSQKREVLLKEQFYDAKSGVKEVMLERQRKDYKNNLTKGLYDKEYDDKIGDYQDAIEDEGELQRKNDENKKVRGQQLVKDRLREVKEQSEYLGGLHDEFRAAQATGYEDYIGATGSKLLEKDIAEGQKSDQVRVLPGKMKNPPPYITELSKDKAAVEKQRQRLGLASFDPQTQAASSSSSGPVQFDISDSPKPDRSKSRSQSRNPQDPKRKPGRKINPDSARQQELAKKTAANK